jgi:hypothetical protein
MFRLLIKNKSGFYSLDIKTNNLYKYIIQNNINIDDIINIIEYK